MKRNLLGGINSGLDTKRISKLEESSEELTQNTAWQENKTKVWKNRQGTRRKSKSRPSTAGAPGPGEARGAANAGREILRNGNAENPQASKGCVTFWAGICKNESAPRHITLKRQNIKDEETVVSRKWWSTLCVHLAGPWCLKTWANNDESGVLLSASVDITI